jgi:EAL domain-containing protein (putative c-di-GMP-specific phosphodiesterase class I)
MRVLRERARVEAELRRAIPAGEIRAHFQPVVNLQTGLVASFEVLARWHHPTRGTILPGEFIHVAEDSGLIGPLTDAVVRDAVQEAAGWGRPLPIAINLSPRLLHDRDLPDRLIAMLEEAGFEPGRLEIEVTETARPESADRHVAGRGRSSRR